MCHKNRTPWKLKCKRRLKRSFFSRWLPGRPVKYQQQRPQKKRLRKYFEVRDGFRKWYAHFWPLHEVNIGCLVESPRYLPLSFIKAVGVELGCSFAIDCLETCLFVGQKFEKSCLRSLWMAPYFKRNFLHYAIVYFWDFILGCYRDKVEGIGRRP